jgi:hypothetical protein
MITICCTSKLIKRTGFNTEAAFSDPTTALGNWYANILFFSHKQLVLFVSEKSRLGVITPAIEVKSLASHLTHHLSTLLERLGAPPEEIAAEVREMADVHFSTTHSKSVLGSMNDYAFQVEMMIRESADINPLGMAVALSNMPVGPLKYGFPGEVTLDLLKSRYPAG